MKISTLIEKPVVSMADGEVIGHVQDFHIDVEGLSATALIIGGPNGPGILPLNIIKNFGADAIIMENTNAIQWTTGRNSAAAGREASTLKKLPVVDGAGDTVGELYDISLDLPGGQITFLHVSKGGIFGVGGHKEDVPTINIRKIGPTMITVEPK